MRACFCCKKNIEFVDWKNTALLERFLTPMGKIAPTKRTHICASHQRAVSRAIKRARFMALLPYVRR